MKLLGYKPTLETSDDEVGRSQKQFFVKIPRDQKLIYIPLVRGEKA